MSPRKIPPEAEPRVVARYLAGETTVDLGFDYDVAPATIARVLRLRGVPRRRPRPEVWTPEKLAALARRNKRIVAVYREGELEVEEIARLFDVTYRTVYRAVKAAGGPDRSVRRPVVNEVTEQRALDRPTCGDE